MSMGSSVSRETVSKTRSDSAIPRFIEALSLWALVLGCLVAIATALCKVGRPFQMNFGEGPLLASAARIAQGLSAYPPSQLPPYVINPYGPLPYYLVAGLVRIFGIGLTIPRLLVLGAAIYSAALTGLLVRRLSNSSIAGMATGALFLTLSTVQHWLPVLRVDMIGLALSLTGLYLFAGKKNVYLAAVCFVAAWFSKFTYVAAPLTCFALILYNREFRKAVGFAVFGLSLSALVFWVLQAASGGWFLFHTVSASAGHPFHLSDAKHWLALELQAGLLVILMAILSIGASYRLAHGVLRIPLTYFLVTCAVVFSSGKAGGETNYFLEWNAALCLCAGTGYGLLRQMEPGLSKVRTVLTAIIICNVLVNIAAADIGRELFLWPEAVSECRNAYQYVMQFPGDRILTENLAASLFAGKSAIVAEPFLWTREVVGSGWSAKPVVYEITARRVDLILLDKRVEEQINDVDQTRWPRAVMEATQQNYRLTRTFDCSDARYAYTPRVR